jgi:DNA-binding CsgD family transcriptional regulator
MADAHEPSTSQAVNDLKAVLALERAGTPFLRWRTADGEQRLYPLPGGHDRVEIGRGSECHVSLPWDAKVSRAHAYLERIGGQWAVVDDQISVNGSFVNGTRVGGHHRLKDRDRLCFGDTYVEYRYPCVDDRESTEREMDRPAAIPVSPTQRQVLIALCRPVNDSISALPATNRQIADEIHLSVHAVKAHLRILFERFSLTGVPQNEKRARLAHAVLASGLLARRDF